jgi:CRISPR/Cas system CSM-associated protein Csm3 (group 7 of RAMP superfamily)
MTASPDFSAFASRLRFRGELTFETAVRIGASRSTKVDEPDLPIVRDALGRPYIPGSSFKGALRSYTESVLRTLQASPATTDHNLACLSVGKGSQRAHESAEPALCLHQDELNALKQAGQDQWKALDRLPPALLSRLPGPAALVDQAARRSAEAVLDRLVRDLSCWTCRVFGAQWLAAKVLIRDLPLSGNWEWPDELRNGVAIDRDAGRAFPGQLYDLEVLPAGAAFDVQILVENASPEELGLLWLGLSAFERGEVPLGGARSRGLGWCQLTPRWESSQYVTAANLTQALFATGAAGADPALAGKPAEWVQAFGRAIGAIPGGQHA